MARTAGMIGTGALMGGVGAEIAGGKFWDGFRNGAISSTLNHVAHGIREDGQQRQEERRTAELIERYNELTKNTNGILSAPIDIAKIFTSEEIAWLRSAGRLTFVVGIATTAVDAVLAINAFANDEPWGWHAYDVTKGVLGLSGPVGAGAAAMIEGGEMIMHRFGEVIVETNIQGPKMFLRQFRLYYGW